MNDPYAHIARIYDLILEPLNEGLRGLSLKLHPPRPGMKVLDVCCGTGVHLELYQQQGCEVHGVDMSPSMLGIAKKRLGSRSTLSLADATAIPYESETFDVVVCMLALHEMTPDNRVAVVGEMKRVVRDDGVLLLIDFNPGPFRGLKGHAANIIITVAEFFAGRDHFAQSRIFLRTGGLSPAIVRHALVKRKERIVGGGTFAIVVCQKATDPEAS